MLRLGGGEVAPLRPWVGDGTKWPKRTTFGSLSWLQRVNGTLPLCAVNAKRHFGLSSRHLREKFCARFEPLFIFVKGNSMCASVMVCVRASVCACACVRVCVIVYDFVCDCARVCTCECACV